MCLEFSLFLSLFFLLFQIFFFSLFNSISFTFAEDETSHTQPVPSNSPSSFPFVLPLSPLQSSSPVLFIFFNLSSNITFTITNRKRKSHSSCSFCFSSFFFLCSFFCSSHSFFSDPICFTLPTT